MVQLRTSILGSWNSHWLVILGDAWWTWRNHHLFFRPFGWVSSGPLDPSPPAATPRRGAGELIASQYSQFFVTPKIETHYQNGDISWLFYLGLCLAAQNTWTFPNFSDLSCWIDPIPRTTTGQIFLWFLWKFPENWEMWCENFLFCIHLECWNISINQYQPDNVV